MALTMDEIVDRQFQKVESGYDTNEVDEFLNRVLDEMESREKITSDLRKQISALTNQVRELKEELAKAKQQTVVTTAFGTTEKPVIQEDCEDSSLVEKERKVLPVSKKTTLVKCPECGAEISESAVTCIHCGKPLKRTSCESSTHIENGSGVKTASILVGVLLQIMALIIMFSFDSEYIDMGVSFGSDYNTYTYKTFAYIAIALRWGLSSILIGIGAILQSRSLALEGKISTSFKNETIQSIYKRS